MDRLLADTNVLLRLSYPDERLHPLTLEALATLMRHGWQIVYTPQCLREFWNVSTRPKSVNGFERSTQQADRAASLIESQFDILHDTDEMHATWRRFVVEHEVKGVQVHDARLAASALVSGCRAILTLNDPDFKRFGVPALHPRDVSAFLAGP